MDIQEKKSQSERRRGGMLGKMRSDGATGSLFLKVLGGAGWCKASQ